MLFSNITPSTALVVLTIASALSLVTAQSRPVDVPGSITPPSPSDYCKQFANAAPSKGAQFSSGQGCSSTVQGLIPSNDKMVSTIITAPDDGARVDPSVELSVTFIVQNLDTGFALNPDTEFLLAPQTIGKDSGFIEGLVNLVIQQLTGISAPDSRNFSFFVSLTNPSPDGSYTVTVPPKTLNATGDYRICTMATSASFHPVIMPVAQRGSQDDCIRITV
ncbi:hypothetical protein BATDEDRAFT_37164 [Batrachochytrium dendrobatidis JAM81]|uniref:Uncharacterized protein n=2 Tax=Batrachochytrium dendrobatidis TaxID=109871 RepID=F4P758_BATDJ|nr:uncharacterized protein BATDEDRAFT_37164 [Batrachochytrium dendrobatidis JAM81]EGF79024.1 hypothetical protein BATDEDRAFT_37164 [Batrachochytrium dendrobatidis JAM81]KAJ8325353.1 hypothetical protein O5D80_006292 [Batrachochytrium dendrobatidis]KAK5667516.1 hypothetical protein QVD99_006104 [Batrachochytrium dendrobatidis]OAJ42380.1 hypothetical protein BDEG_25832 [Batrachochytrium dendrobatidis JEL423]|eukprot:XP_006680436.1 hypothetical protein BATDEDRAFT_37164 [Batrachochytrium dendrobatidis JAM81]